MGNIISRLMKPRSGRGSDLCGRHEQRRGYLERAGYTLLHFWFRYCGNPNPDHREHHPRVCPDEAHLHALLHQLGVEQASITQACADVQKGGMAVLLIAISAEQLQTC